MGLDRCGAELLLRRIERANTLFHDTAPMSATQLQLAAFRDRLKDLFGPDDDTLNPIATSHLSAFEERHQIRLPEDYRQLLLQVSDGLPGPEMGLLKLEEAIKLRADSLYELAAPFEPPRKRERVDFLCPGVLPLIRCGLDYYQALVISGPERGRIWSYIEVDPGWVPTPSPKTGESTDLLSILFAWLDEARDHGHEMAPST